MLNALVYDYRFGVLSGVLVRQAYGQVAQFCLRENKHCLGLQNLQQATYIPTQAHKTFASCNTHTHHLIT